MIRVISASLLLLVLTTARAAAQPPPAQPEPQLSSFAKQILVPDLFDDEHESEVEARPAIFIQTRFSSGSVDGATHEDAPQDFELSRIETPWTD